MNLKSKILNPLYNLRHEQITDKMWGEEIIITEPTIECWALLKEIQENTGKIKNKGKEETTNNNNEQNKKNTAIVLIHCLRDSEGNLIFDNTETEFNQLWTEITTHHIELCNKALDLSGNVFTSSDPIGETEKK